MWNCILAYSGTSGSLFLCKKTVVSKKKIHYSCEGRIEKSVPRDHRLSSLGMPCDAKRWSLGLIFFYPTPTLKMDSYNIKHSVIILTSSLLISETVLTLCMLGNISYLCCNLLTSSVLCRQFIAYEDWRNLLKLHESLIVSWNFHSTSFK